MSLILMYKLYKNLEKKEKFKITKNKRCLIRNKYLKKVSI